MGYVKCRLCGFCRRRRRGLVWVSCASRWSQGRSWCCSTYLSVAWVWRIGAIWSRSFPILLCRTCARAPSGSSCAATDGASPHWLCGGFGSGGTCLSCLCTCPVNRGTRWVALAPDTCTSQTDTLWYMAVTETVIFSLCFAPGNTEIEAGTLYCTRLAKQMRPNLRQSCESWRVKRWTVYGRAPSSWE